MSPPAARSLRRSVDPAWMSRPDLPGRGHVGQVVPARGPVRLELHLLRLGRHVVAQEGSTYDLYSPTRKTVHLDAEPVEALL